MLNTASRPATLVLVVPVAAFVRVVLVAEVLVGARARRLEASDLESRGDFEAGPKRVWRVNTVAFEHAAVDRTASFTDSTEGSGSRFETVIWALCEIPVY